MLKNEFITFIQAEDTVTGEELNLIQNSNKVVNTLENEDNFFQFYDNLSANTDTQTLDK